MHVDQLTRLEGDTIADALGVSPLVDAFTRVDSGNATMEDLELLEDKWHLPAIWQSCGLSQITRDDRCSN